VSGNFFDFKVHAVMATDVAKRRGDGDRCSSEKGMMTVVAVVVVVVVVVVAVERLRRLVVAGWTHDKSCILIGLRQQMFQICWMQILANICLEIGNV
jgi:hypothetical protein